MFTLNESRLGEAVLAGDDDVDLLERALTIISNGSFPQPGHRNMLTNGQRRQLRDAMIFEAHVRQRRHVLVTEDAKGFVGDGRREQLEHLGRTRILSPTELEQIAAAGRLGALLLPPE